MNKYSAPAPATFINTLFVSWKDLGLVFDIDEEWDLVDYDVDPKDDIINAAFSEAFEWAKNYQKMRGQSPSHVELLAVENKIKKSITKHWSSETVLPAHLDLEFLLKKLNDWSQTGPKNKDLFGGIIPPTGLGIEMFTTKSGISLTVYPSFIIPYTELYYDEYEELPEWNVENLNQIDVAETFRILYDQLGKTLNMDLTFWDNKRERLFP